MQTLFAHRTDVHIRPEGKLAYRVTAGALVLEPPACQLHGYIAGTGLITHMAYVERFAGPIRS